MIRLVTDSTSQLTPELRERFAVRVVPTTVLVDQQPHLEGEDIDLAGITAALERGATVGTATPSPGQFLRVYEEAMAAGAVAVLSVHTGGATSGTANAARVAATMAPLPVEVVDTGSASFPVALCTWAAGEVLAAGGLITQAAEAARVVAAQVDTAFVVGTLALAVSGGRLAADVDPSGVPVLGFAEGAMTVVGRVTDPAEAVEVMASYAARSAAGRQLRIGVGHLAATDLADALELALRERIAVEQLVRYDVGPSVAVHTGLGTVGCVFHPL